MRLGLVISALTVLSIGCGSHTQGLSAAGSDAARGGDARTESDAARGSDAVAESDASSPDLGAAGGPGASDGTVDQTPSCWQPNLSLPSPVACSGTTQSCDTGSDACLRTSAANTLLKVAQGCGFACGDLLVGFVAGCAAWVNVLEGGVNADVTGAGGVDAARACFSDAVLGQRWACTPDNGWVRIYVGSCTLF